MNKLIIPPSPNWYSSNILACASDNTIVYGSRNEIIIIYPSPPDVAAEVKILGGIHSARITFVSINANWGNPNKWAVSVAEDNVIHLIDVATCASKISHVGHKTHGEKVVGAVFSGEDKVVSVSEKGFVIMWKLSTNNLTPVSTLSSLFVKVSTVSSCPHAPWVIAFGLKKGGILIVDFKKSGRVLYRINAHEEEIISLSWCPSPYNVIPRKVVKVISRKRGVLRFENSTLDTGSEKETVISNLNENASSLDKADVSFNIDIESKDSLKAGDLEELKDLVCDNENEICNPYLIIDEALKEIKSKGVMNTEFSEYTNEESNSSMGSNEPNVKSVCYTTDIKKSHPENVKIIDQSNPNTSNGMNSDAQKDVENVETTEQNKEQPNPNTIQNGLNGEGLKEISNSTGEGKRNIENFETTVPSNEQDNLQTNHNKSIVALKDICDSMDAIKDIVENVEINAHSRETVTLNTAPIELNTEAAKDICDNKDTLTTLVSSEITLVTSFKATKEVVEETLQDEDYNSKTHIKPINLQNALEILLTPVTSPEDTESTKSMVEPLRVREINIQETGNELGEHEESSATMEYLLASCGRGSRSIKIWRAGTDGLLQTELFLPSFNQQRSFKNNDRSWIPLCWATPSNLLSSSKKGQLLVWDLRSEAKKNTGKGYFRYRTVHADHTKHIFCIASPLRKYESKGIENWRSKNTNAWTVGNDRFLLNTSLDADHQNLASYSTIGGTVSCLMPSPIDPTRIACGINDGFSKIWDLSQPHLQKVVLTPIPEKYQIKVSCFAWNPFKEHCLAYGTSDGQVGLLDVTNLSKSPTHLVQYGLHPVYHLQWGPLNGDIKTLGLYCMADGNLVVYDTNQCLREPKVLECCVNYSLSSFCWRSDYSLLAVSTKDYELLLFNNEFQIINTFWLQNKTVRYLAWHPLGTPEENWLAICSNNVIVYDVLIKESDISDASLKYDKCAVAVFTEHQSIVHYVTWSPHNSELLASASEDGSAMVWNVKTRTLLHTCYNKYDVLYAVLWSPFDPDYIITGGRGCVMRIWKLSENPPLQKLEKIQRKPTLTLKKEQEDEGFIMAKAETKPKKTTRCLLHGIARFHNVHDHSDILGDCKKIFATLYPKSNGVIDNGREELGKNLEFNILKLFGDKEGIADILQLEKENHHNRTTTLCLESVSMYQGNIGEAIRNAIKCESLNSWLVGAAPMVSYNLWQEACEAYAKQLLNTATTRPVEAAYFYLACHKVEEAINALLSGLYFREALILAKCRLSPTDPLINKIIENFAIYCTGVGKYEIAAQCYLVLHKLEEAAKVLFRRSDVPTLELCVKVAEESGNKDLLSATLFRLNAFKSETNHCPPLETRLELEFKSYQHNIAGSVQDIDNKTEKDEINDVLSNNVL